jgi:PDZ domain-containing protein
VTDTRDPTLTADDGDSGADQPTVAPAPRPETEGEAAARAGVSLAPAGSRWIVAPVVVLAMLLLFAIPVASGLPSSLFVHKPNTRLGVEQGAGFARVPASALPVDDRVSVGDLGDLATQYPPNGDIYFVTVMNPPQSLLSWVVGKDEPEVQFLTREEVYGFQTPSQRRTLDLASMRTAEQVAQYVALQRIGYDVSLVLGDVLIEAMVCLVPNDDGTECVEWSPSDSVLDPGDKILAVDGEPIATTDDLSAVLDGKAPGDVVSMQIERPDLGELTVDVELTASPDDPDRTIVGFFPFDTTTVELPFELSIDTGRIGGPSAGLAFTLTLIDELTEGELTGGGNVAVTGTIALDGTVGPIGGLRQKASAVAQAGVDVFIVPTAQGPDDIEAARDAAGGEVEIIPVANLDEALAALESVGGDPLPAG